MKLLYLLFTFVNCINCTKIIKNINTPTCKNCIYYIPNKYDKDFTSLLNKCNKFGYKDIITDKIYNDYADACRNDENKCGIEGKYFKEEKNIKFKILNHYVKNNLSESLFILYIILISIYTTINLKKKI
jgi:hypothetical protein